MTPNHAILLINTGSPASTEVRDVRSYLTHFLTDPRIIGLPELPRQLLVRGIIAPFRAPASARKYAMIYTEEGSPLVFLTERLARKMQELGGCRVYTCMRYTPGSVRAALELAQAEGIRHLSLIPLFPHYAISSWETAVEYAREVHRELSSPIRLEVVRPYYDDPLYIRALAEKVVEATTPGTHLVVSFHGIPLYQVRPYADDPARDYVGQTDTTLRLLSEHPLLRELNLSIEKAYQSRFGHNKWLSPSTLSRLTALPGEGTKRVAVICPGFVCDSLETIWEIDIEAKEQFRKAGGEELTFIPCPNDSTLMARSLLGLVQNG